MAFDQFYNIPTPDVSSGVAKVSGYAWEFIYLILRFFKTLLPIDWILTNPTGIFILFAAWFIYYYYKVKPYPIKVVLHEKRGDSYILNLKERLGHFQVDGLSKWIFRRSKDTLPPQDYSVLQKVAGGGQAVHMLKYGKNQYKIIDVRPAFNDGNYQMIDYDDMNWGILEHRAVEQRRMLVKEKWEQYAPIILPLAALFVFIITVWLSYSHIEKSFEILKSMILSLKDQLAQAYSPPQPPPSSGTGNIIKNILNPGG